MIVAGLRNLLHMASLQFRLPTQCSSLFSAYGIAPISFADAMQQLVLRLANLHAQRLFAKAGEKKNQSEVQGQLTYIYIYIYLGFTEDRDIP